MINDRVVQISVALINDRVVEISVALINDRVFYSSVAFKVAHISSIWTMEERFSAGSSIAIKRIAQGWLYDGSIW